MKLQYHILPIYIIIILFSFLSCSDQDRRSDNLVYGKLDVAISVTLPEPKGVESTSLRSARMYSDTDIENVDVLVFDENHTFIERVQIEGSELTSTSIGVSFTVRLDLTTKKRIIHLVTNGRTVQGVDRLNFSGLIVGGAESDLIPSLVTNTLSQVGSGENAVIDNIMPLIMWGRVDLDEGINMSTKVNDAKLLRSVANIQVKKGTVSASNGLDSFDLESISVYKASGQGYLAPQDFSGVVTTPLKPNSLHESAYLNHTKAWCYDNETSLYVYERNCSASDYMSVIIKATYKGTLGYYKVVIVNSNGQPLDIIRNHRYIISIIGVDAPGYGDLDTVVNAAPSNALKIELKDDDIDFPFLVADGEHVMGLTNNAFSLLKFANVTEEMRSITKAGDTPIELCTVYSSGNITPKISLPSDVSWIDDITVEALSNNKYSIQCRFHPNNIPSTLSTTLTLICDNISQVLKVEWASLDNQSITYYVIDLVQPEDRNWSVKIESAPTDNSLALHPTDDSPSIPDNTMFSELSSKYYSHAYLHTFMHSGDLGKLKKSSVINGEAIVRKIAIQM